jgi:hypothetical protein
MMGGQGGMMGGWGGGSRASGEAITVDQAAAAVERYLAAYGGGLTLKEVMEFRQNFYAEVEEEATGIHAMELLVDKYTGRVFPEMGPNMLWNTKYGKMQRMMGSYYEDESAVPGMEMPIGPQQAEVLAQQFVDGQLPGATVGEADRFYGYYTLHTLIGGRIEGMLSVNGYSGQVWYHSWHGPFVQMKKLAD